MISTLLQAEFSRNFPFIQQASEAFKKGFFEAAQYVEVPAGTSICDEGQQCAYLTMVLGGMGRVYKLSPSGREITLYRIQEGESCVLTASCIMNQADFPAMAITETMVRGIMVNPKFVRDWFCREPEWQQFILGLLSHRLSSIIAVVEEVAFKRLDVRLAEQFARSLEQGTTKIDKTHAELAADVGSSREVVSRVLRDFTHRGLIISTRGHTEIIDVDAIKALSRQ